MSTPRTETEYRIALAHSDAITAPLWKKLTAFFPDTKSIWEADPHALERAGMTEEAARNLQKLRATFSIEQTLTRMEQHRIRAITPDDAEYPRLLKEIPDPPFILFVQGQLAADEPVGALGVVGTRKISSYGQTVLPPIITECAHAGLTIVSGLALGIDGLAHATTIENSGRTIAVIGSGIDRESLYPWQHRQLADRIIASGGAIVSEYPPGTAPLAHHFPARNRIISGLAAGVLVCEAPEKSGALITAFAALDQNREVFAIPGPVHHPNAKGPNDLLKRGAVPVTEAQDIMNILPITPTPQEKKSETVKEKLHATDDPIEQKILAVVGNEIIHIDAIVKQTDLTADVIMSTLVLMEMRGAVRHVGGMQYTLS